ncbi:hypothetical protein FPV67DRAFT_1106488 [Lyophyllum atratum]|nr:hypothetical protein FPV67DRAFT_1106488 [Lyophyllum atratum]
MMRVNWGGSLFVLVCMSRSMGVLSAAAQATLSNLRVDPPVGTHTNPLFSWTVSFPQPEVTQNSYQISISKYRAGASDVWSSGVVAAKTPLPIEYSGPPLSSHTYYFWNLQVETTGGSVAASSQFLTGTSLLARAQV